MEVERPAYNPDSDYIDDHEFADIVIHHLTVALERSDGTNRFSITTVYAPGGFDTIPFIKE